MHPAIKRSYADAGVRSFRFNYPADPKERAARTWSVFVDSVDSEFYRKDAELQSLKDTLNKRTNEVAVLREELDKVKDRSHQRGVKVFALENRLAEDEEQRLLETTMR